MRTLALVMALFTASKGFCQTPSKENNALQSLLFEVHELRQDIETMTVASQRVQIALSMLQLQDAAVARAAQHAEELRSKCALAEADRQHMAAGAQRLEALVGDTSLEPAKAKSMLEALAQTKLELEAKTAQAGTCQAAEADASSQLRNDQAKLAELAEKVDRIDQSLEKLSTKAK